jgi:predicted Zn-dependent protease
MGFPSWLWRTRSRPKTTSDADRVRRISSALLASVGPGSPSSSGWPRRAIVVRGQVPNAFCRSDGTISLSSALLEALNPTDDELAFVIGHEMAHAMRGHGREQALKNMSLGLGSALTGFLFGHRAGDWIWLLGQLVCQRMSRKDEKEADRIGMCIAANAGFDPRAALSLLERAAPPETRTPLDWFSTHPLKRERLRNIQANLMEAWTFRPGDKLIAAAISH